jgi:opacity protein-like surface antigen
VRRSLITAVLAAVLLMAMGASAALAGEVTGSGANSHQNQGVSWCSFSGLNDDPGAPLDGSSPNGPGGTAQSYGQDVKLGLADPHGLTPGVACNPNRTFLPPNPNRTK